jgi:hypothetical protein
LDLRRPPRQKEFAVRTTLGRWLLPVLVTCALSAGDADKDRTIKNIISIHTRVYSVENMLIKPFAKTDDEDHVSDWHDLMTLVTDYVHQNAASDIADGMMTTLNDASEQLLLERKSCYNVAVKRALATADQANGLSEIKKDRINFAKLDFSYIVESNNKLQSKLKGITSLLTDIDRIKQGCTGRKRGAFEVVETLAVTLQATIIKFQNDLIRLKKAAKDK